MRRRRKHFEKAAITSTYIIGKTIFKVDLRELAFAGRDARKDHRLRNICADSYLMTCPRPSRAHVPLYQLEGHKMESRVAVPGLKLSTSTVYMWDLLTNSHGKRSLSFIMFRFVASNLL